MRALAILFCLFISCTIRPGVVSPIRITAQSGADQEQVNDAAHWWNARIGCRVFADGRSGSDVVVREGTTSRGLVGLWVKHDNAIELFGNLGDNDSVHFVLVHELGHVLGIDHSDNPKSIMYSAPLASFKFMGTEDEFFTFPWVESATLARVRAARCVSH